MKYYKIIRELYLGPYTGYYKGRKLLDQQISLLEGRNLPFTLTEITYEEFTAGTLPHNN